jgi:protein N-terminal glutamine amidohydrolase
MVIMDVDPAPQAQKGGEGEEEVVANGVEQRRLVAPAFLRMMTAEETALQCARDHDLRVAYYCEENVWRLAYRKRHHHHDSPNDDDRRFWVVFISNAIKNVPMFQQRASSDREDAKKSVCWDYHVILISKSNNTSSGSHHHHHHHHDADDDDDDNLESDEDMMMVYDIDSRIVPYPCPLHQYIQESFPYEWPEPYNPMFRVIPADLFLSHFSSDRSHMLNRQTGEWTAPPPPYAPIVGNASNSSNNLQHYLNFVGRPQRTTMEMQHEEAALGQILSKTQFAAAEFAQD